MKTIITILSILTALTVLPVYADIKLEDNSKILGKWKVTAESLGLDKEKKKLNVSWDFKNNGTIQTISEDSLGRTSEMDISIKYSVENGLIKKQTNPGREKYEDCAVLDLSQTEMTLKCKGIYFFLLRK